VIELHGGQAGYTSHRVAEICLDDFRGQPTNERFSTCVNALVGYTWEDYGRPYDRSSAESYCKQAKENAFREERRPKPGKGWGGRSGWVMRICAPPGTYIRLYDTWKTTKERVVGKAEAGDEIFVTSRTQVSEVGGYLMRQLADGRWIANDRLCRE
jgi:hypothetical protein